MIGLFGELGCILCWLGTEADGESVLNGIQQHDERICNLLFGIVQVDPETNEIAGVFESLQPSDADLGSKAPKDVKIIGIWCAFLRGKLSASCRIIKSAS